MKKLFATTYYPEQLETFQKSNLISTLTGNILVPSIMVFALNNIIPNIQLYTWFSLHIIVFITRLYLRDKINSYANLIFFLISFSSFLWAVFAWLTLMYGDGIHMIFVAMTIASLASGSITTLGGVPNWFFAYVSIQMIGLFGALLSYNQEIFYLSALLSLIFLFFVLSNGYKQFSNTKKILNLNKQVSDLLNNTKQGFLSFNEDLKCDSSFSAECKKIFNLEDISNLDISELLFSNSERDKDLFLDGISRAIATEDKSTKEIFLSLLPKEQVLNKKDIKIEYKHLKKNKFMLVLTDVTNTNRLQNKLSHQNQVQKMIVAVASNRNDFLELKNDFELFIKRVLKINAISLTTIKDIQRELHTFKGIFAQKEMIYIAEHIHFLEANIRQLHSNEQILYVVIEAKLGDVFQKDIDIIKSVLGDDFLTSAKSISVNIDSIDEIESKLASLSATLKKFEKKSINNILDEVKELKNISLKQMLIPYISHIKLLSTKLEKEIYKLEIEGDANIKVPSRFKPFMRSLIHVFNNCADHGIEGIETRIKLGKDEVGKVKCSFQEISDMIVLQISDDGSGIDTNKLSLAAIEQNIKTKEELELMSEEDICKLIFTDNLSTKQELSETSGIGIGMSIVKKELEKLDAKFNIDNKPNIGVTFTFYLPLRINTDKCLIDINKCKNICENISTEIENYLHDSLELTITNEKNIKKTVIENNYAQIDFSNAFTGSVIMIFSDEIIEIMNSTLIPSGFSEHDRQWLMQELPSEVLNTVLGLSIKNFADSLKEIEMSPPVYLDNFHLMQIIKETKNKFIKQIDTSAGKVVCIVIEKEEE